MLEGKLGLRCVWRTGDHNLALHPSPCVKARPLQGQERIAPCSWVPPLLQTAGSAQREPKETVLHVKGPTKGIALCRHCLLVCTASCIISSCFGPQVPLSPGPACCANPTSYQESVRAACEPLGPPSVFRNQWSFPQMPTRASLQAGLNFSVEVRTPPCYYFFPFLILPVEGIESGLWQRI